MSTAAVNDSFAISSFTDVGTGLVNFTFTNPFAAYTYSSLQTSGINAAGGVCMDDTATSTATFSRVAAVSLANAAADRSVFSAWCGDLA
jgi:hypothetical protein